MGAHPYRYIAQFNGDVRASLEALRQREFEAGRYSPVMREIRFPITSKSPAPGPKHKSIQDVLSKMSEEGTRSILDILKISDKPAICTACKLEDEVITRVYGTALPTRQMVETDRTLLSIHRIERGHAIYFLIYENDRATEVFFAGYSFD
ncbi:hypothetical protein BH10PLA1_BH10PLA1_14000 [soil metagenome]